MESPAPMPSKERLKLKISTNHADGTSKIVSNRSTMSPAIKSNHAPGKDKDNSHCAGSRLKDGGGGGGGTGGSRRDGSKRKHEHDGVSYSSSKDAHRSSSDKHRSPSSSSSSKPAIKTSSSSSSKPKESSSSFSKPKDGKPTSNGERAKDGKSSSGDKHKSNNHSISSNSSSSKPSSNSVKPKDGSSQSKSSHGSSSSSSQHHKSSSSSSSSRPKEGGEKKSSSSSSKPRDGSVSNSVGSPPPSSNSLKPKSSSGSGDHHKSPSSSSKPRETSSSKDGTPKTSSSSSSKPSGSSSRPLDKKPSSSSSSLAPKMKDETRNKENHESHSSHKDKSKDGSISKPKEGEVRPKSESKDRDHGSGSKSKTNSSSPAAAKMKTEPNGKVSSHDSNILKVKPEPMSDEDIPLTDKKLNSSSSSIKKEVKVEKRPVYDDDEEDSEDEPLYSKLAKKPKKEDKRSGQTKRKSYAESSDEDEPVSKKMKKAAAAAKTKVKTSGAKLTAAQPTASPVKKGKKAAAEEPEVWKWWEEEKKTDGSKWKSLEHKGPVFAPDYEPLPKSVKFYYNGKHLELSQNAEEIATFYARMLDHDYTSKDVFNNNFMKDWRKSMTSSERDLITDLGKCDFKKINAYFLQKTEERKNMTKEEKQVIKKQNQDLTVEYGFCIIDGHKEKIGNFKIEPPGLFRGRGEHPKMGRLKKRTMPEDVIINCSKGSKIPEPPKGHKWKEVRHDNMVSWLASWTENVQNQTKYVMLNPSSKLKGEKDWQKYETARKLKTKVGKIRQEYQEDWRSKEMRLRQRAVALYFIDKLALRAGNEKDSDETADTVGCCSLRVEHIKLHERKAGKDFVVDFDFLGKDSIRYFNSVAVEKRVFKNLQLFMQNKQPQDDLFDRLNTTILNKYLNDLMEGLTAKVFRTFNASMTLQDQLLELTIPKDILPAKLLSYNRANRAVAILCNHQRAVSKTFDKSMENMNTKITAKKDQIKETKKELKDAKGNRSMHEKKSKALERLKEQLDKLEMQATDKEENKQIALGTSKLNYLDPRISVAWCKKWEVPIERIFTQTHRDKFRWAIDMAGPDYVF